MKQRVKFGIIGAVSILALGNVGFANTLDLTSGFPDITGFGLSVTYTLGTGGDPNHLSVTGSGLMMPVTLDPALDTDEIFDGSYTLDAFVDDSGNLSTTEASTLTIDGFVLLAGSPPSPIGFLGELSTTLTNIGTNSTNTSIDFTLNPADYSEVSGPSLGSFIGGKVDITDTDFNGWDKAFDDGGSSAAQADTFGAVPTPAALPGGLVILGGIFALRKKLAR